MISARRVLFGVLLLAFAASCRVDTTVDIAFEPDGSGDVAITMLADEAAADRIGRQPDSLAFDDLIESGWTVDGPTEVSSGLSITVTKPFSSPSSLAAILDEAFGPGVIFTDVALERELDFAMVGISPARTDHVFRATVDPAPDLNSFGSDEVADRVGGFALGREAASIESEIGVPLPRPLD